MESDPIARISELSTAHLADACVSTGTAVRCGPASLKPLTAQARCHGRVLPVRHVGSVDVFLEALEYARPGDVLVVDNGGRVDEACVGDLITLEVKGAGLSGIVIWGLHRDSAELVNIGLPVFSLGALAAGPQRLDPRSPDSMRWARVGSWVTTAADYIVCDSDGVLLLPAAKLPELVAAGADIAEKERRHAEKMRAGVSFRQQTRFPEYLAAREANPELGFRAHLKKVRSAIET